jgi:penicillin amidase
MGVWLSGDWRGELERARLLAAGLPMERLQDLHPRDESAGRPDLALPAADQRGAALPPPLPDAARLARLAAALPAFPADPGSLPASASNAWAVARGGGAASGKPLLASDPHLGFQAPVLWYLARIDLPGGRFRAGATAPGVPLVVIGRNESVAWGFTTTHSDTQDLFVERLAGPGSYETPEGPRPFAAREEAIRVRGEAGPRILRVRETRHGPVLSDLDEAGLRGEAGTVVAAAMANLAPGDTAAQGLLALNRATSLDGVQAAAALITSPPQNLLATDAQGRIGLFLTGRTPRRPAGQEGWLPARGWDGGADWDGFIPFDAMPHVQDPPGGVLVNANNRVAPPEGQAFLGRDWFGDWRFRRIGQMLAERGPGGHDAAGFAAMQNDVVSLLALEMRPLLRATPRPAPGRAEAQALDLLLAWDGIVAAHRPEPLIHHAWRVAFGRLALIQGGVPADAGLAAPPEFLRALAQPESPLRAAWCGGDCATLSARALEEAVAALAAAHGPDPAAWRWGAAHVARFDHPLLRFVPGLAALTGLEASTPGDNETVSRGGMGTAGRQGSRFAHVHGAGLRLVADLADPDGTLAVIATGQSGHPFSRHWGDMLARWRDGGTVALARAPAAVAGRITLRP